MFAYISVQSHTDPDGKGDGWGYAPWHHAAQESTITQGDRRAKPIGYISSGDLSIGQIHCEPNRTRLHLCG